MEELLKMSLVPEGIPESRSSSPFSLKQGFICGRCERLIHAKPAYGWQILVCVECAEHVARLDQPAKCSLCDTGEVKDWGKVLPRKLIDIRGEKAWRHEHERDHMFTSLCEIQ